MTRIYIYFFFFIRKSPAELKMCPLPTTEALLEHESASIHTHIYTEATVQGPQRQQPKGNT